MYLLRFDLRAPAWGPATSGDLYRAVPAMAEWAEANGAVALALSEHHGSDDGYLPSPLVLAAAVAARTARLPIQVAAVIAPLHDPLRLAEDMAVVDLLSRGRAAFVLGIGYRPEEFAMFGRDMAGRGPAMEELIATLRTAWTGQEFQHRGATVRVTPAPHTPGGPVLAYGGGSTAAARRAGRLGLDFIAQSPDPELRTAFEQARDEAGAGGSCLVPDPEFPTNVVVVDDVDEGWASLGPHLLHDARCYADWAGGRVPVLSQATSVEELRAEHGNYRVVDVDGARALAERFGFLSVHPLCGGIPPERGWRCLELLGQAFGPAGG